MPLSPTSWPGSGQALTTYRKVTAKVVNSTIAETDLLNSELTVGAGALGASGVLVGRMWGDWKQNSGGAAAAPRLRFKFGATTVFDFIPFSSMLTVANVATRYGWALDVTVTNQGAANAQAHSLYGFMSCNSSSVTTAIAQVVSAGTGTQGAVNLQNTAAIDYLQLVGTSAIDTASSVALALTTVNGSNSANYEVTLQGALFTVF